MGMFRGSDYSIVDSCIARGLEALQIACRKHSLIFRLSLHSKILYLRSQATDRKYQARSCIVGIVLHIPLSLKLKGTLTSCFQIKGAIVICQR